MLDIQTDNDIQVLRDLVKAYNEICSKDIQQERRTLWSAHNSLKQTRPLISPHMHDEFMLQYQIPIMEQFGLIAYGCCEDLTDKIDILRQVKNLRRIAVAPRANLKRCVDQIQDDYVISWRPNPAEMVCCGFDSDHVKKVVKEAIETCKRGAYGYNIKGYSNCRKRA